MNRRAVVLTDEEFTHQLGGQPESEERRIDRQSIDVHDVVVAAVPEQAGEHVVAADTQKDQRL